MLIRRIETSNIARAVRAGDLVRVVRGVYAPTERWQALAPWERHLARVHAVAPSYPDGVMILEAGAALRGLPIFGEPREVDLLLPSPAKSRRTHGVRIHTPYPRSWPSTSPARGTRRSRWRWRVRLCAATRRCRRAGSRR